MAQEPVSADEAEMPGYWRFMWMFFMQPITLHYRLRDCGVDNPNISGWNLLKRHRELHKNYKEYIKRASFILFTLPTLFFLSCCLARAALYIPLPLANILLGTLIVISIGILITMVLGIAIGAAISTLFTIVGIPLLSGVHEVASSNAFDFRISPIHDWKLDLKRGLIGGGAGGLTFDILSGVVGGVSRGIPFGTKKGTYICFAAAFGFGALFGVFFSTTVPVSAANRAMIGLTVGPAISVMFIIASFRLIFYLLEILIQYWFSTFSPLANRLQYAPVMLHNLSYLPHPGLAKMIVETAPTNPHLAHRAITAASRAPGQKDAAANAQAELAATEIATLASNARFTAIVELQGEWLPGQQTDSALLQSLSATARFMLAAQHASSPYLGLQHLDKAEAKLAAIDNQLPVSKEALARFLPPTLRIWRTQLASMRAAALSASSHILPNPFMVSNPLSSETSWGQAVFRGREATIAQVETLLADQHNSTSIALIGPRRCGKSSLLNMLRVMLPDTIVVLFDLLGNPVNTPLAFYQALAKTAQEQARRFHQQNLPDLPQGEPIEALKQWFDQLEQFEGAGRILICLDEFERLETLFPDQTRELPQLMGLLRATIQHRRRLRLLISGAAPFDELGKLWNDHFINLREIRLGYLDQATTSALLHAPIPEFPASAIPPEVAQQVYARSRGQPFLAQVYGHTLIETLNREQRQCATLADIEQIEPEMLQSYNYYFNGIWQDLPAPAQAAMQALAQANTQDAKVEMDKPTQKWLRRRLLIDEHGHMLVPLFGRWVRGKDEVE